MGGKRQSAEHSHLEKQAKYITEMIRIFVFTSFFCFIAGRNTGGQDYGADVTNGDYVTRPEETTPPVFVDKWHENGTWEHYERCSVNSDCRKPGQKCHNLADASCICKSGKCKMINGFCGTYNGHGFLTPCSTCDKDSCKAAGDMCRWVWKSVAGAKCEATSKGMEV